MRHFRVLALTSIMLLLNGCSEVPKSFEFESFDDIKSLYEEHYKSDIERNYIIVDLKDDSIIKNTYKLNGVFLNGNHEISYLIEKSGHNVYFDFIYQLNNDNIKEIKVNYNSINVNELNKEEIIIFNNENSYQFKINDTQFANIVFIYNNENTSRDLGFELDIINYAKDNFELYTIKNNMNK